MNFFGKIYVYMGEKSITSYALHWIVFLIMTYILYIEYTMEKIIIIKVIFTCMVAHITRACDRYFEFKLLHCEMHSYYTGVISFETIGSVYKIPSIILLTTNNQNYVNCHYNNTVVLYSRSVTWIESKYVFITPVDVYSSILYTLMILTDIFILVHVIWEAFILELIIYEINLWNCFHNFVICILYSSAMDYSHLGMKVTTKADNASITIMNIHYGHLSVTMLSF